MRVAVAAAIALTCQLAHANPPGAEPTVTPPGLTPAAPLPEPGLKSYRGQTLAADGVALGLLVVALSSDDYERADSFGKLSIGTFVLGAPLVHLTKQRTGRALGSLTMRVGFPIIGGMLASGLVAGTQCDGDVCYDEDRGEVALGILLGAIVASGVDMMYLAKGDAPKRPEPAWTPTARASQGGFSLGVLGQF
jgi:hypothetical protein